MKFKKTIIVLVLFLFSYVQAQQDAQYTQYMYNTMTVNPGYAGSKGYGNMIALARMQWVGLEGAPTTQTIAYDTPIGESGLGLGMNIIADQIGPSQNMSLGINGAYKIATSREGNLSLGVKIGGRYLTTDWSRGKHRDNRNTQFSENVSKLLPELGFGLYYYTKNWYVGTAVPNVLSVDKTENNPGKSKEKLHSFTILGIVLDLNKNLKLKPTGLLKIAEGAPTSFDVSANLMYKERFTGGLSYRLGNYFAIMGGVKATRNLFIGYSYDMTTTALRQINSGSHEIALTYDFINKNKNTNYRSPRFF